MHSYRARAHGRNYEKPFPPKRVPKPYACKSERTRMVLARIMAGTAYHRYRARAHGRNAPRAMDTALHTACIQQYSESVKHAVFACALSIFAVQIAAVQCAAVKLGLAACSLVVWQMLRGRFPIFVSPTKLHFWPVSGALLGVSGANSPAAPVYFFGWKQQTSDSRCQTSGVNQQPPNSSP